MPGLHHVASEVVVDPSMALGVFTNAFRVQERGSTCLLEFLVYSATEDRAVIVGRVPVRKAFLPVIRDQIAASLGANDSSAGRAISTSG
jgi:hypothetical protein